ncbi:hypothetical protein TREES_T100019174 [Tupaia chinensis]|uniref:Uncharacterized protein n=1 Tax=Tupaia chinensis TaxID=246437 RepID=L9L8H4_TUPCH|nr:hypothetical protein TREES_T100019174 [Tupaia chinensis]
MAAKRIRQNEVHYASAALSTPEEGHLEARHGDPVRTRPDTLYRVQFGLAWGPALLANTIPRLCSENRGSQAVGGDSPIFPGESG